jgi:phosphate transport system substrate-binding protein
MSKKNESFILILSVLITGAILALGFWWFTRQSNVNSPTPTISENNPSPAPPNNNPSKTTPISNPQFPLPADVAKGTGITIDGSTSMVEINQRLKQGFEAKYPGTVVITDAQGSDIGIKALLLGNLDLAGLSRPLTPSEEAQGLKAIPIAKDAIAIVIGFKNPFTQSLTQAQVAEIFNGQITDWSGVGGSPRTIRVINRPEVSGTRQTFQELVLKGVDFGTGANFTTLERDATTPIFQDLGTDGISYATYSQAVNQDTVRTIPIDGLTPQDPNYPYQRNLYYAYKEPPNSSVKAFLGYVLSNQGQQAITAP